MYISPPQTTTLTLTTLHVHQWVEKRPPAQVATGGTTTSGVFAPIAEGKCHRRKLQPVATTMCATGVLVLVDRRITPLAHMVVVTG